MAQYQSPLTMFYGRKDGLELAWEFIEDLEVHIDTSIHFTTNTGERVTRSIFRSHLADGALRWYRDLPETVRLSWIELKARFLEEYKPVLKAEVGQESYIDLVYDVRQRGKDIVEYVRDTDRLYRDCPANLHRLLGRQFVAGLEDKAKIDAVSI